jgi:hypothetical protein
VLLEIAVHTAVIAGELAMPRTCVATIAVACSAVIALTLVAAAQTRGTPMRYTAAAFNLNRGAAGNIDIVVERWSSDQEHNTLMEVMLNKGPERLLDALQDMPRAGSIKTPDSLGWDLHFARRTPVADGGERVLLATDRRIGFWEAANQPRSIDYPFTIVELRLNRDGEGEGKISLATKIIADKENNIVTLENYDLQPVMLTGIKSMPYRHD